VYARFASDLRATAAAQRYLDRLLSLFDREEGWFREYDGPDPGYQTRTLRYLVKLAGCPGYHGLWDVATRAGEFLTEFVMPDGSVHPMLGARSTAIVYPSGIEALAARHPDRFSALAARVRRAWDQGLVPLPSNVDFANAIRLADDARDAFQVAAPIADRTADAAPGKRAFPHAGLTVWRTSERQVYVASALGGVVVAYERDPSGWRLALEDSGYLFRSDGRAWLTRMPGAGRVVADEEDGVTVRARFARVLHDAVTPARLVLLRLLNLTLLRSQWMGDWFRKLVVGRLMADRAWLGLTLTRRITMEGNRLTFDDSVESDTYLAGSMWRCRRLTGAHMASARYFQHSELQSLGGWQVPVAWDGRRYVSSQVR
jgi:hypothetical protein